MKVLQIFSFFCSPTSEILNQEKKNVKIEFFFFVLRKNSIVFVLKKVPKRKNKKEVVSILLSNCAISTFIKNQEPHNFKNTAVS